MKFDITKDCAHDLDNNDPLNSYRKDFYYPKTNNGKEGICFRTTQSMGTFP